MNYGDRHRLFPNMLIISHPNSWGGQFADRWMWMAELNGEVYDYNSKANLIKGAVENDLDYVVLRVHKDATISIMNNRSKR